MKIAVIGSVTQDEIVIPERNEKFYQPGGGVYYASAALAFLGAQVLAVPILSRSDSGLLEALDISGITVLPLWTDKTTKYRNTYYGKTLDVCEKKILSAVENVELDKFVSDKIMDADAVHLAPLFSKEFKPTFYTILRAKFGKTISLDGQGFIQGPPVDLHHCLSGNINILKLDDSEILKITSKETEKEALNVINGWDIREILVTKASRGSSIYYKNDTYQISAHKPGRIVDATGCGDAYIAGYLFKRIGGCSPVDSANYASEIASKNLEYKGALRRNSQGF